MSGVRISKRMTIDKLRMTNHNAIDPAAVAFDIDSVIADTMQLFLDIARDHYRINKIRYEDFTAYDLNECLDLDEAVITAIVERIQEGRYTARLKPIDGAPEVLAKLSHYHSPVRFVTARQEYSIHMQDDCDDHGMRAPTMQLAKDPK